MRSGVAAGGFLAQVGPAVNRQKPLKNRLKTRFSLVFSAIYAIITA
jgi:hypothetical protein